MPSRLSPADSAARLQRKPWLELDANSFKSPSPLHLDESRFLYWLGENYFVGDGVAIDVYSPESAATTWLAAGLSANTSVEATRKRLFSFSNQVPSSANLPSAQGGSSELNTTLNVEQQVTLDTSTTRIFHRQDVPSSWGPLAIEMIYLGSPKRQDFELAAKTFFKNLIPGHSLLIIRDYVHTAAYWLHLFMEHYAGHFDVSADHILRTSAVWRLKRPLPAEAFTSPIPRMSVDAMLRLLERSIARYDQPFATSVAIAKGQLVEEFLGREAALNYGKELEQAVQNHPRSLQQVQRFLKTLAH